MTQFNSKKQIKLHMLETERLLSLVKDHPLMSIGLKEKLEKLKNEYDNISDLIKEPKIKLLFSGKAIIGSKGIKAKFVTDAIKPFQELVKTQTALVRYGKIGKRGKSKNSNHTDLYLTSLPTGSFGIELSQLEKSDIFSEEEVSEAIVQVMDLIESSVKSDETFEEILSKTPVRNLNNLKIFFKVIDKEESILKMESGSKEINISEESIHKAYERVNAATKEDEEIFENGVLRGVMLETGKFEFVNDNGYKYSGLINPKVPEEMVSEFLNRSCHVHIKKTKTKFISGNEKTTYELIGINTVKEKIKN